MQETTGASESGSEVHAKLNAYNRFRLAFCAKARHNGNFREQRVNLGGGTEVIVSLSTRYDAANPVTWSTPLNMSVYTYWSGVPAPFVVSVDNVSGDLVIKGRGREHVVDPTKSKDLLRDLAAAAAALVAPATAAAEPQSDGDRYRFFLHFWVAHQAEAEALTKVYDGIAEKAHAEVHPTRYERHNDGVRVRLRCTVHRKALVAPLLHALMSTLPKQHGFMGFSNDEDADDSFIRADDKAGVAEVFKALVYEATGAAEPRGAGLSLWKRIDKADGHHEVLTVRGARSPLNFAVSARGGGALSLVEQDPVPHVDRIVVRVHDTGMPGNKGFGAQVTKPLAKHRVDGEIVDITHALDNVADDSPKALARVLLKVYFDYLKEHNQTTAAAEPDGSRVTLGPVLFNIEIPTLSGAVKKMLSSREPGDVFGDKIAGAEYAAKVCTLFRKELTSSLNWLAFVRPEKFNVSWKLAPSTKDEARREIKKFVSLMHDHFGINATDMLRVIKSASNHADVPTIRGTKIDVALLRECAKDIGAVTAAAEPGADVRNSALYGRYKITVHLVKEQGTVQNHEDALRAAIRKATGSDSIDVWITGPTAPTCVKVSFTFNGRPSEHPAHVAKAVAAQFTDVDASELAAGLAHILKKPDRIPQLPMHFDVPGRRTLKVNAEAAAEPGDKQMPSAAFAKLVDSLVKHPKAPFRVGGREIKVSASHGAGQFPAAVEINVSGRSYYLKVNTFDDNVVWYPGRLENDKAPDQNSTQWDMSTPEKMLRIAIALSVKAAAAADKRAKDAEEYLRKLAARVPLK